MSYQQALTDPAVSAQTSSDSFSPARRDVAVAESRRHGPVAGPSTNRHELPEKLIDAWSRWAASRLS
jgi:hypothetical protein